MSKARDIANLAGVSETPLSNRNLIINGAMQVAQRGTSVTGQTTLAYHTVDRWQSVGSGSTYNQSQQSVTLGDSTVGAFKYFLRHEVTTANDFAGLLYKIEDVQSVPEGTVTLSFYAKGTNPGGGQLQVRGRQNFGTGGSPSSDVIETAQALVLTSSWQRFTYTFNVPSISGKTLGTDANSSYYRIDFQQPGDDDTTDAWTLDITGVQLEVGEQATPFEHRSYGDELARCQRYYQKSYADGTAPATVTNNGALWTNIIRNTSNQNYWDVRCYQVMRSSPTVSPYSTTSGVSGNYRNVTDSTTNTAAVANTSSSGFSIRPNSGTNQNIGDVIAVHWVADAEL